MKHLQQAFSLLDRFVEQQMRQSTSPPGMVIAMTDRQELLHLSCHGFADVAREDPVTPDTLFEIGSISKSFAAIALLQMQEAGEVDLQAPVDRYLPWFHVPSKHDPITLHHLLSHTGGITVGTDFTPEARFQVWALRETEATAPPGTMFHYSNAGYKALGLVLEEMSGQSYREIIQERVLDPLGMTATETAITHETRKRLAVGYEPYYDDRPAHGAHPLVPATWLETGSADDSVAATAADMATYLRMLMNRGQGERQRILSEQSFVQMSQRAIEAPEAEGDQESFYGYGLGVYADEGHTLIGHSGEMVGYNAAIVADLDDGLGVVVLTNGPGEPWEIAQTALKLLRAAHHDRELPPLPPDPRPDQIENATEYAGVYRSEARTFRIVAEGATMIMHYGDERITLERRGEDRFYAPHPDWELFLLHFGRDEGQVAEAFHGADWYVTDSYTGPTCFALPAAWLAYPGHYASHNPWRTNFRVVSRKGELVLIKPSGDEEELAPLGHGLFRVGGNERSPERLYFDTVINGQAIRANLSGCDFYRAFTP